jgi:hypothetical protein
MWKKDDYIISCISDANICEINDILNEELNIGSDDELYLEIEKETASEESSNKSQKVRVRKKQLV